MQTADTLSETAGFWLSLPRRPLGGRALEVRPGQRKLALNLTELIALPAAIRKRVTAYAYTEVFKEPMPA